MPRPITAFGHARLNTYLQNRQQAPDSYQEQKNYYLFFHNLNDEAKTKVAVALQNDSSNIRVRQLELEDIKQALETANPGLMSFYGARRRGINYGRAYNLPGFCTGSRLDRYHERLLSSIVYGLVYRQGGNEATINQLLSALNLLACRPDPTHNEPNPLLADRQAEQNELAAARQATANSNSLTN